MAKSDFWSTKITKITGFGTLKKNSKIRAEQCEGLAILVQILTEIEAK